MNLKNKTLFITGISDFIGLRAAEMAMERGMKVCGLELLPEKAKKAQELGAQVFLGSTTDEEVLERACEGADIVFHTAAVTEAGGSMEFFRSVNVGEEKVGQSWTAVNRGYLYVAKELNKRLSNFV